ncbi:MAG: nitrite reductase cytochrome c biosis protein NrfJ [Proteobacteria bacterium]|nr:nitrite reductase cytochrome c biosis protein NrfJ [Pseudomonadota bacterium]
MNKMKLVALSLALIGNLHAGDVFEGTVVDTINGGGYTYLQIDDTKKKYWVAVEGIKIEKGTEVRFTEELRAKNFESKALNRKFDEIVFASNLQHRTNVPEKGNLELISEQVKESPYKQKDTMSIKEAWEKRASLKDKTIAIRGKVVKASPNIIGRNWIHIQDGTGEGSEVGRIVFTSKELPKVGDIVTASGVVSVEKDFGSGYFYKIIVENATFKQ